MKPITETEILKAYMIQPMTSEELELICAGIWDKPLSRPNPDAYGSSQIPFCLEKMVISHRIKKRTSTNAKMIRGKLYHNELPNIISNSRYGKYPKWRPKMKPKYEILAQHKDNRGFEIQGHVDCYLPYFSTCIELKTTESNWEYRIGDFLTDAYIMQANSYACMVGAKYCEIWIINLNFRDIQTDKFCSIIRVKQNQEDFSDFLDRVYMVNEAIKNDIDLAGPEISWECNWCSFIKECPYWDDKIKEFLEKLPSTKSVLTSTPDLESVFKIYANKRKWIRYNRTNKVYELI